MIFMKKKYLYSFAKIGTHRNFGFDFDRNFSFDFDRNLIVSINLKL